MKNGFPEAPFLDNSGMGIGYNILCTVNNEFFLDFKLNASLFTRINFRNLNLAANGSLMRTSCLGILDFWDIEKVLENTRKIEMITHIDQRCIAVSAAQTSSIA